MESQHEPRPLEDLERYEAPSGVELGTLAELTAGKSGQSSDTFGSGEFPSH